MALKVDEFLRGVVSGRIRPADVHLRRDKSKGQPFKVYSFPTWECEIHVHFDDENLEQVSYAKIKTPSDDELALLDNYTVAMLRHYAEDRPASAPAAKSRKHRQRGRAMILLRVAVILLMGVCLLAALACTLESPAWGSSYLSFRGIVFAIFALVFALVYGYLPR